MMKHWSQIPDDSSPTSNSSGNPTASPSSTPSSVPTPPLTMKNTPKPSGLSSKTGQNTTLPTQVPTGWTDKRSPCASWHGRSAIMPFSNSPSSTPERKENFILYVAAQAERIYKNIGYAISTRSNHTISEAFGLWMVGLLFPELKHAEKYLSLGKQLLEQEAANQIFPDGSYSMYSLNYHRFILHIYLYAIRLGEINNSPFSNQSLYIFCIIQIHRISLPPHQPRNRRNARLRLQRRRPRSAPQQLRLHRLPSAVATRLVHHQRRKLI